MRMGEIGASVGTFGRELLATLQVQSRDGQEPSSTLPGASSAAGNGDFERSKRSEAAIEGLRGTLDRLASSIDTNQRQLLTKLEDFNDRLRRVERSGSDAADQCSDGWSY
jgi:hypothetical protein